MCERQPVVHRRSRPTRRQDQGCYDATNHAKVCKAFGNKLRGSKKGGWQLTAPGLAAAAELIKATTE